MSSDAKHPTPALAEMAIESLQDFTQARGGMTQGQHLTAQLGYWYLVRCTLGLEHEVKTAPNAARLLLW